MIGESWFDGCWHHIIPSEMQPGGTCKTPCHLSLLPYTELPLSHCGNHQPKINIVIPQKLKAHFHTEVFGREKFQSRSLYCVQKLIGKKVPSLFKKK